MLGRIPAFFRGLMGQVKPPKRRQPKIGLALSSGGAKGLCHIGVIEVLEENNIPIHAISGSSMGSYIAALYACGTSVSEMKRLAKEIGTGKTLAKLVDPSYSMQGFITGYKAKAHIERTIHQRTFDNLERELLVIATDLDTYERVVFREGIVSEAVHASCAIPGIVVPPEHNGRRLTDGGVVDPVPVSSLQKFTSVDHVIAVSTLRQLDDIDSQLEAKYLADREAKLTQTSQSSFFKNTLSALNKRVNPVAKGNVLDTLRRSLRAAQIRLAHESCKRASVALHPATRFPCNWDDYKLYQQLIDFGREAALKALPELKQLTEPISDDHRQKVSVVGDRVA